MPKLRRPSGRRGAALLNCRRSSKKWRPGEGPVALHHTPYQLLILRPFICGIRTTCKLQAFVPRGHVHSKAWRCDGHTHTDPSKGLCSGRHSGGLYRTVQGAVDYSRDFFGRPAYLTVSGQMQGEFFATALSNVYTFGPTFRAEGGRL